PDRGGHVRLNLRRRQGAVVNAHLVDEAGEVLTVDAVTAHLERVVRSDNGPGPGRARDERPVDVEVYRRAVVSRRQVGPGVGRNVGRANGLGVSAAHDDTSNGIGGIIGGRGEVVVVIALVNHVPPQAIY